ncbi:chorismate-binding protein [Phaeovibrio sulfidiphilus]|nr:chorismate-binding protein [Phaeovibrio sulfidiphilus]
MFLFRAGDAPMLRARGLEDVRSSLRNGPPAALAASVRALLDEATACGKASPLFVGALPLHGLSDARAYLASEARFFWVTASEGARPAACGSAGAPAAAEPEVVAWASCPDDKTFRKTVHHALDTLAGSPLEKLVLARRMDVVFRERIDDKLLFRRLNAAHPNGSVFRVPWGCGHCNFLGASSEPLVRRKEKQIEINPLAGLAPQAFDTRDTTADPVPLPVCATRAREHRLARERAADILNPFCKTLTVPPHPSALDNGTGPAGPAPLSGVLKSRDTSSVELAAALHPAPSTCGSPVDAAHSLIARLEPFGRGLYSGLVGWCNADGDGEWTVALQCAEIHGKVARLFTGVGLSERPAPGAGDADSRAGWSAMLRALGVSVGEDAGVPRLGLPSAQSLPCA